MADLTVSLPDDPGIAEAVGHVPGVEFVSWNLDGPAPSERIDIVVRRVAQLGRALELPEPVSYTHLDVYKRQVPAAPTSASITPGISRSRRPIVRARRAWPTPSRSSQKRC